MARKKKKAHEMTDKELLRSMFPKEVRKELKKAAIKARKKGKK